MNIMHACDWTRRAAWDFATNALSCYLQWAEQGVLLLNTVLTVRAHEANSHAKKVGRLVDFAAERHLCPDPQDINSELLSTTSSWTLFVNIPTQS